MKKEVLKTEDLNQKTKWQRKTYPLKLNLTDIQQLRIENMIWQYKKCTNKVIQIVLKEFFPRLRLLTEEDWKEGHCPLCQSKRKLKYELTDFKFVKYKKTKDKPNFKPVFKKNHLEKICDGCHCSHYSLRKFLMPSKDRDIPIKSWDFTLSGKLTTENLIAGTGSRTNVYDSCLQKAVECIKSQEEIKKKINWKLKFYRERIINNTVMLNEETNKSNSDHEEIRKLKNYIRYDEKSIEKEKRKEAEGIVYKNDAVRLYENTYQIIEEDEDYFIKLKDYSKNKWITLSFYGKDHQKKMAKDFITNKNAETEIVRKKDDFYLQYIYKKELKVPVPDKTFTAVGIDINIINLASYVSMNKNLIPKNAKFFSGRYMREKRKRFSEIRKIWNSKMKYTKSGGKGRSRKWFNKKVEDQNEKDYVKYQIHNLTTKIVQEIKDNIKKPVIVLENLKDIRERIGREIKITKCSLEKLDKKQQRTIRGEKLLKKELNNWNFADFQSFIEYKANWLGIPVVYVSAKNTSIKCNKCGNIKEENYKNYHTVQFKCLSCGYECNADFNASVNIARNYFNDYLKKDV